MLATHYFYLSYNKNIKTILFFSSLCTFLIGNCVVVRVKKKNNATPEFAYFYFLFLIIANIPLKYHN